MTAKTAASATATLQKAMTLHRDGALQQAFDAYMDIIDAQPRHLDALYMAGVLLVQVGEYEKALQLLDRALAIFSNHYEIHYNRGNALSYLGRHPEALKAYSRSLELQPTALGFLGQGNALVAMGHPEHAVKSYESGLQMAPADADLLFARANALESQGNLQEANEGFGLVLKVQPTHLQALHNRANVRVLLREYAQAREDFEQALRMEPMATDTRSNLGALDMLLGDYARATRTLEEAVALDPQNANVHYTLSHCLLQQGHFEKAWQEYDWRWQTPGFVGITERFQMLPLWTAGQSCKRLLVWAEQGVGDEIFWSGVLTDLQAHVEQLTVQTDARLIPLLSRAYPKISFVAREQVLPAQDFDAQIPMGNLGAQLRASAKDFAGIQTAYLQANKVQAAKWREKILQGRDGKIVGISWRSKNPEFGARKSMSLDDLLPLLRLPGCIFVNLQYGDVREELAQLKAAHGVEVLTLEEIDNMQDLAGLADLMQACDQIVTTSNTTAHLAGALGRPTQVLLPRGMARIWYWINEVDGRSLWYPTARLLPQTLEHDGWRGPVSQAIEGLQGV